MEPGKVAIVGSGIIGLSWAVVFARAGHRVSVYERPAMRSSTVQDRVLQLATTSAVMGGPEPAGIAARIETHFELAKTCIGAIHVQESISENVDQKRKLFAELDGLVSPNALIASSTSGIPVSSIASGLAGMHRCLVAHPATPPHLLPVVEIVPATFTSPQSVERAFRLMKDAGMKPVLIRKERPGFVLNRLQIALLKEMFRAISQGLISPEDADSLIRDGFGLRWAFLGPLEGIDLNAPGGIADYLDRYKALFDSAHNGVDDTQNVLAPELLQILSTDLRARFPLSMHPQRIAARDARIAKLRALRDCS